MIRHLTRLLCMLFVIIAVSACGDTWKGAKQDTGENLQKTGDALNNAGDAVKDEDKDKE